MDEPKHVAERYDWKYILLIAKVKVVLDRILYLYYYWNTTGMSRLKKKYLELLVLKVYWACAIGLKDFPLTWKLIFVKS
jgi:hypothetical protein